MDLQLKYLIIVKPNGLPIYSQSFDFEAVFACQTFNNRLTEMGEKKELLGGYFNAIKDILAEVIQDQLRIIDLGFHSYRMTGLVLEGLLFIGIFELSYKTEIVIEEEIFYHLRKIADCFIQKYEQSLEEDFVDLEKYENFTKDLIGLGLPISIEKCRNCLIECTDVNMGCLPHLIYFQDLAQ
jgi:hypothetical protein